MPRPVVIARNRLHTLTHTKDKHDAQTAKGVDDAVGPHRQVATIMYQLAVEQGNHTRSRNIHQERTHADEQDITEDIQLGFPRMTTETDKRTPLQEMPNGNDTRAAHGDGCGPCRTSDTPIQGVDKQGIEAYVKDGTAHHNPH